MDETVLQRKFKLKKKLDNMSGKCLWVVSAVALQVNKQAPSAMLPISAKGNGISWV